MQGTDIIFEDDEILVVYKPAGIATQTAGLGQMDMVGRLKNYLAAEKSAGSKLMTNNKSKTDIKRRTNYAEPYLGIIHRLDQPVEGLLVFAKNKTAAAELSRQITNRTMAKYYYGVVDGIPEKKEGELRDLLGYDKKNNCSFVVAKDDCNGSGHSGQIYSSAGSGRGISGSAGIKEACLNYRVLAAMKPEAATLPEAAILPEAATLIEIKLETGRHHQIRVQMAHAGLPLMGDTRYGSERSKEKSRRLNCAQVALCAARLELAHPCSGARLSFVTKPRNNIFQGFSSFFTN